MTLFKALMLFARNSATVVVFIYCITAGAEPLPRFPDAAVWYQNIANAALHPQSASMIATLLDLNGDGNNDDGFGLGGRMQIDFSLHVVHAPPGAPTRTISWNPAEHNNVGYFSPDCEDLGTAMPVPAGSAIEGHDGLICDNNSEDCHLLVVQDNVLYEAYRVTEESANELQTQCLAIWQLGAVYPPQGRGDHCTSADAAGFPMAPLLFNADEIAASLADNPDGSGNLGHAIRFILPNDHMASDDSLGGVSGRLYVRPASHAGGPSGPVGSVPYGARLRLRADFPLQGYNPAARVILNTFKQYGIVLADGGSVALTAESDKYTTKKWSDPDIDINSRVFDQTPAATDVTAADFEVIDTGPRIAETYECVRTELSIYADHFESTN